MIEPARSLAAAFLVAALYGCGGGSNSHDLSTAPADLASPIDAASGDDLAPADDLAITSDQAIAPSSAKAITAFSFTSPVATGVIDESAKTIALTVPYALNVNALVASFTTTGATVAVGATAQVSGTTANDFTSPVTYTVTAADASTASYVVTVHKVPSAPVVAVPVAAAAVVTPLTVQGSAVAGATVDVKVNNGATTIGTGTGTATATGRVNFIVAYTEPAATTALSVVVTQTIGGETSTTTTAAVTQGVAGTVTFGANQNAGGVVANYSGAKMYLEVYANTLNGFPLQSKSFDVTVGTNVGVNSFGFRLAAAVAGTNYYFIGFRDSNGNGIYDAGEPVTNGATRIAEMTTQGGNNIDSWTMQPP